MNGELLAKAVGRILSERSGRKVTVRVTSCRNCTHLHSCRIESDRGPCKDYEDSYGSNNQAKLPKANRLTRTVREDRLDHFLNPIHGDKVNLCDRGERNRQKREREKRDNEAEDD